GCSGEPAGREIPRDDAPVDADAPVDPESSLANECLDLAARSAQAQGDRVFVEAGGATYTAVEAHWVAGDRVLVTAVVDQPDLVGYDTVAFLSQCGDGEVTLLGGYVPEDGAMLLLFTTNEGSAAGNVPTQAP